MWRRSWRSAVTATWRCSRSGTRPSGRARGPSRSRRACRACRMWPRPRELYLGPPHTWRIIRPLRSSVNDLGLRDFARPKIWRETQGKKPTAFRCLDPRVFHHFRRCPYSVLFRERPRKQRNRLAASYPTTIDKHPRINTDMLGWGSWFGCWVFWFCMMFLLKGIVIPNRPFQFNSWWNGFVVHIDNSHLPGQLASNSGYIYRGGGQRERERENVPFMIVSHQVLFTPPRTLDPMVPALHHEKGI